MTFIINDVIWAETLQRELEEYRMELYISIDEEQDIDTESGQPFCGCETCDIREILAYATPRILKAAQEGKVELDGS